MDAHVAWQNVVLAYATPEDVERGEQQWLRSETPGIRVGVASERWLSLGISQQDDTASAEAARSAGIPVHRRSTGGAAVLLGKGDLIWSILLPRSHPLATRPVTRAYARLGEPVVDLLARRGIPSVWGEPLGLSEEFCPFGPRGSPLLAEGRVIGGAAQQMTAKMLLHHGFLLVASDRPLLQRLFQLPEEHLGSHLGSLEESGCSAPAATLADELLHDLVAFVRKPRGLP